MQDQQPSTRRTVAFESKLGAASALIDLIASGVFIVVSLKEGAPALAAAATLFYGATAIGRACMRKSKSPDNVSISRNVLAEGLPAVAAGIGLVAAMSSGPAALLSRGRLFGVAATISLGKTLASSMLAAVTAPNAAPEARPLVAAHNNV